MSHEVEKQNTALKNKWCDCGFVCNAQVSLKTHMNTTEAPLNMKTKNIKENTMIEGIDDHYQIEVLDGEQVRSGTFYIS